MISNEKKIFRISKLINESKNINESFLQDIKTFVSSLPEDADESNLISKFEEFLKSAKEELKPEEKTSVVKKDFQTDDDSFYESVLNCLGAPVTDSNMLFFYAWRQAEGGTAKNNPFNTTYKKGLNKNDYTNYNKVGVKNYMSKDIGVRATCSTLKLNYYTDIVDALKQGNAFEKIDTLYSLKKWGTGNLLGKVADGYIAGYEPKPKPIA